MIKNRPDLVVYKPFDVRFLWCRITMHWRIRRKQEKTMEVETK